MKMYENPDLIIDWDGEEEYSLNGFEEWISPSNLAIIKYWGKHGQQLPQNPSISLTLSEAQTRTTLEWYYRAPDMDWIEFIYDGEENKAFAARVEKFFTSILPIFPFLEDLAFIFHSKNSFPHSAGIASSASAMSALALGVCNLERYFFKTLQSDEEFYRKASYVARLGSGSACRSLYGGWVQWGKSAANESFTDMYGTPVSDIHASFRDMKDSILIASRKEKSVSSSAGHQLMVDNVYAPARYQQAEDRLPILLKALKEGDWTTFGKIAENEALTLHALMMSSEDSYILIHPNTLKMIDAIRAYREKTGNHVYFSLDAGPNIHMLYPAEIEKDVKRFIKDKLLILCQGGKVIYDQVGFGPEYIPFKG